MRVDTDMKNIRTDTYDGQDRRGLVHRMISDAVRSVGLVVILGVAFYAGQLVADSQAPSRQAKQAYELSRSNNLAIRHINASILRWNLDARLARIGTTQSLILDELRELRADTSGPKK